MNTLTNPVEASKFIVVIVGPSGSGKTDLLRTFVDTGLYSPLISTTTRPPRPGEENGKDYFFVNKEEFEALHSRKGFVQTVEFKEQFYGTSVLEVERVQLEGKIPAVIVEPSGITQFLKFAKEEGYRLLTLFVEAPAGALLDRYLRRVEVEQMDREEFEYHAKRIYSMSEESNTWFEDAARRTLGNPGKAFLLTISNNKTLEEFLHRGKQLAYELIDAVESRGGISLPTSWGEKAVDINGDAPAVVLREPLPITPPEA